MYHRAGSIMRVEDADTVSKRLDPFTIEPFGDIVTGESPAATQSFDTMIDSFLSKTKTEKEK